MRIALAIEENKIESNLSEICGRSNFFLILDSQTKTQEIFPNPFASSYGGGGIQTARILIEKNCDVLITKMIGTQTLLFLESAAIKVFLSNVDSITDALNRFEKGLLKMAKVQNIHKKKKRVK